MQFPPGLEENRQSVVNFCVCTPGAAVSPDVPLNRGLQTFSCTDSTLGPDALSGSTSGLLWLLALGSAAQKGTSEPTAVPEANNILIWKELGCASTGRRLRVFFSLKFSPLFYAQRIASMRTIFAVGNCTNVNGMIYHVNGKSSYRNDPPARESRVMEKGVKLYPGRLTE